MSPVKSFASADPLAQLRGYVEPGLSDGILEPMGVANAFASAHMDGVFSADELDYIQTRLSSPSLQLEGGNGSALIPDMLSLGMKLAKGGTATETDLSELRTDLSTFEGDRRYAYKALTWMYRVFDNGFAPVASDAEDLFQVHGEGGKTDDPDFSTEPGHDHDGGDEPHRGGGSDWGHRPPLG